MSTFTPTDYLLAIDIETTDLDIKETAVLEFAAILLDNNLNEIDRFGPAVLAASDEQLARMNDYVREMHTNSGLLHDLEAPNRHHRSIASLDREVTDWLATHGITEPRSALLLGSSCRFDLGVIEYQMPKLARVLHYRMLDISGLREALARWAPEIIPEEPDKNTSHRAMDDIEWSVADARRYREALIAFAQYSA